MPCYQVRTLGIDLALADRGLLLTVSDALELNRRGAWITDRQLHSRTLSAGQLEQLAGEVKRAYAAEAVKVAAKRFGWQLTHQSAQQFTAQRRF